jgi:hypothetical protein
MLLLTSVISSLPIDGTDGIDGTGGIAIDGTVGINLLRSKSPHSFFKGSSIEFTGSFTTPVICRPCAPFEDSNEFSPTTANLAFPKLAEKEPLPEKRERDFIYLFQVKINCLQTCQKKGN